jgi:ABC-2 type transport system permease protein
MSKTMSVAWREFSATVFTKGFLIGMVMTPVLLAITAGAVSLMKDQKGPRIVGSVAIIDRSGLLEERIKYHFSEQAAMKEADEQAARVKGAIDDVAKKANLDPELVKNAGTTPIALPDQSQGPRLSLEFLPKDTDANDAGKNLEKVEIRRFKAEGPANVERIAVVVVEMPTITGDAKGEYPDFTALVPSKLDFEVASTIERRVSRAIVDARIAADDRFRTAGLTAEELRKLVARPGADVKNVSATGVTKSSTGQLKMLVPMAFMLLLMMSVLTSSQYLLTSTVEEKSNRVMEVLLSAVSPMQLMTGKILGYMGVGILVLVLYGGLGIAGLIAFALMDLIDPMQLVYLGIFFAIAYFLIASLMAAIGAAVNEMKEAQAMMAPVMVIIMIPWLTWFLIQRAPNSTLATTLSFIPGANPFVMMIRLCGSEPVPTWQIPASIAVGIASVVAAGWAAGKIFRIGALMYGKPPNFKTLWRWIKMA